MSYSVIDLDKFKNQIVSTYTKIETNENVLNKAKEENITPDYMVYHLIHKQSYLVAKGIWRVIGCNLYWREGCGYVFFTINEDGDLKSIMPSEAQKIYFDFLNSIHLNIFDGTPKKINREIPSIKEFPVKYLFDCRNWFDTNLFGTYLVFKNDLLNRSIYKYFSYIGIIYVIFNNKFRVDCMDNRKTNVQMIYDYLYGDIKDFEEKYKNEIWYLQSSTNISRIENENPANFIDRIK